MLFRSSFPDFKKLAEAFGFDYILCESNEEVEKSLEDFLSRKGNILMEVLQQIDNPLVPKVMSRMRKDGTFETPALHDMAPFLPKSELNQLMLWEEKDE